MGQFSGLCGFEPFCPSRVPSKGANWLTRQRGMASKSRWLRPSLLKARATPGQLAKERVRRALRDGFGAPCATGLKTAFACTRAGKHYKPSREAYADVDHT
jgi:hypothetical protein